jgi:hypothetical protein
VTLVTRLRIFFVSIPMIPVQEGTLPAWPECEVDRGPDLAARGIVLTLFMSLPFWIVLLLVAWHVST